MLESSLIGLDSLLHCRVAIDCDFRLRLGKSCKNSCAVSSEKLVPNGIAFVTNSDRREFKDLCLEQPIDMH